MNNTPDLNRKLLFATLLIGTTFGLLLVMPIASAISYLTNG